MASRKRTVAQDAKRTRAERRRLKELGLISKHVDLRKKPSKQQLKTIEKYRDVLTGKAVVLEAPKGRSREYKGFIRKGRKIIVPKKPGERVDIEKDTGRIIARPVGKRGAKRIIVHKGKLGKPRKGKKFFYSVPFANGQSVTFDKKKDLADFMVKYKTYKNWRQYIEITEVDDDGSFEPEGDE